MILDPPKESPPPASSSSSTRPRRPPLPPSLSSHTPSRPRRSPSFNEPQPQLPPGPPSIERIRELIANGETNQVLLAQSELLSSIFTLLSIQAQRQNELDSALPPYSHPPPPLLLPSLPPPAPSTPHRSSTPGPSNYTSPPTAAFVLATPSPSATTTSSLQADHLPPTPPTTPSPQLDSPSARRVIRRGPVPPSNSSSVPLDAAPLKQTLKNHFAALGVRVLSNLQTEMVEAKAGAAGRTLVVEGGSCEGKTTGMLMSLLNQINHPSPNLSSPQILILTPTATSAHSLHQLLPSSKPSVKSLTLHSYDPREDARNLLRIQPNVVIGTIERVEELAGGGGVKGKGRSGGLRLEGVRWVGVEEGVWEEEEGREAWKRVLGMMGEGRLRRDLRYIFLSSRPPTSTLSTFVASLHPPPHLSPLSIVGQHDVDFLRSPFVKHFHISTPTPISSLLPIHQTLLSQLSTLIFCSTPASLRSLSQALDERRAEYSSLHPDDSPQNSHVFFPRSSSRSSSSPSPGGSTSTMVPFLTTPFQGHPSDRVACVVNWDGPISVETYIQRAKKLDAHGSGRRVVVTFTSTVEEESIFLESIEELEVELSSLEELQDLDLWM